MDTNIVVIEQTNQDDFEDSVKSYLDEGGWRVESSRCGIDARDSNGITRFYQAILVRDK